MCFKINKKVTTHSRRKAWKVVDRIHGRKGVYRSAVRSCAKEYRAGKVTEADMDFGSRGMDWHASSGIYVYTELAFARKICTSGFDVIIEVSVSAKDFLHQGVKSEGPVATYRKVKTVRVLR